MVRTSREAYVVSDKQVELEVTVSNASNDPVYLDHTSGYPSYTVQRLVEGEWIYPKEGCARILILQPPITLSEHDMIAWQFSLFPCSLYSSEFAKLPGTFRFVIHAQAQRGSADNGFEGDALSLQKRASNAFEVKKRH